MDRARAVNLVRDLHAYIGTLSAVAAEGCQHPGCDGDHVTSEEIIDLLNEAVGITDHSLLCLHSLSVLGDNLCDAERLSGKKEQERLLVTMAVFSLLALHEHLDYLNAELAAEAASN